MSYDYADINNYEFQKTIGEGNFAKVRLSVFKPTKEEFAIKIINKKKLKQKMKNTISRENEIISRLKHPNIIKVINILEDLENYYIIMENCQKGELFDYIVAHRYLSEKEASIFFYQLINGVEYIHSQNIVHRDLKPENLLLTENKLLKIIDFGLSHPFDGSVLLKTKCGSPSYAAPEIITEAEYDGFKTDVWCCGVILYAMLCGFLPFEGETDLELFKCIVECDPEIPRELSKESKKLIRKIFTPNPKKRITIPEIKKTDFYLKGEKYYIKKYGNLDNKNEEEIKTDRNYGYIRNFCDDLFIEDNAANNNKTINHNNNNKSKDNNNNEINDNNNEINYNNNEINDNNNEINDNNNNSNNNNSNNNNSNNNNNDNNQITIDGEKLNNYESITLCSNDEGDINNNNINNIKENSINIFDLDKIKKIKEAQQFNLDINKNKLTDEDNKNNLIENNENLDTESNNNPKTNEYQKMKLQLNFNIIKNNYNNQMFNSFRKKLMKKEINLKQKEQLESHQKPIKTESNEYKDDGFKLQMKTINPKYEQISNLLTFNNLNYNHLTETNQKNNSPIPTIKGNNISNAKNHKKRIFLKITNSNNIKNIFNKNSKNEKLILGKSPNYFNHFNTNNNNDNLKTEYTSFKRFCNNLNNRLITKNSNNKQVTLNESNNTKDISDIKKKSNTINVIQTHLKNKNTNSIDMQSIYNFNKINYKNNKSLTVNKKYTSPWKNLQTKIIRKGKFSPSIGSLKNSLIKNNLIKSTPRRPPNLYYNNINININTINVNESRNNKLNENKLNSINADNKKIFGPNIGEENRNDINLITPKDYKSPINNRTNIKINLTKIVTEAKRKNELYYHNNLKSKVNTPSSMGPHHKKKNGRLFFIKTGNLHRNFANINMYKHLIISKGNPKSEEKNHNKEGKRNIPLIK